MATIGQLVYEIGANTQGLNQAVGAINRMATVLGNLDSTITRMDQTFTRMLNNAANGMNNLGGSVSRNANQIQNQMDRATASFIKTSDQVDKLNTAISRAGANPQLIQNNINAFFALDAEMRNVNNTTAQLAVARAVFNSTLSDSTRQLNDTITAQKAFDAQLRIAEQAEIRQTNAIERMRIKYAELKVALEDRKAVAAVQALDQAFQHFETTLTRGTMDAAAFAAEMNKMNAAMAKAGQKGGMKVFGGKLMEIVSSSQIALGPLSGVASRISAFSAMASRGGLAIAGVVTGIIAMGAAMLKAATAGAQMEQQQLRINAAIIATGNEMGTSVKEIEKFAQAADAALTGIDIGKIREIMANVVSVVPEFPKDKLVDFVKQAQGLSFLGRGDAESSSRRLAKLYADPLNNLNALTDAGVKFNAMEERQIKLLTQIGDKEGVRAVIEKKLLPLAKMATEEGKGTAGAWDDVGDSINKFFETAGSAGEVQAHLASMLTSIASAISSLNGEMGLAEKFGRGFSAVLDFIAMAATELAAGIRSTIREITRLVDLAIAAEDNIRKHANRKDVGDSWLKALDKFIARQVAGGFNIDLTDKSVFIDFGEDIGDLIDKGLAKAMKGFKAIKDFIDDAVAKATFDPLTRVGIDFGKTLADLIDKNFQLAESTKLNADTAKLWATQMGALDKAGLLDDILEKEGATRAQLEILVGILKGDLNNAIGQATLELVKQRSELANILQSEEARAVIAARLAKEQELRLGGMTDELAIARELAKAGELARIPFEEEHKTGIDALNDQVKVLEKQLELAKATEGVRAEEIAQLEAMIELGHKFVDGGIEELGIRKQIRALELQTQFEDEQRALEHQLATQQEQLRTMFQSDATAERSLERFQKEFELRQKYGGILDSAYQTELATFDLIQKRAAFIEEEMQALDDMISTVFDSAKSALQDIFFNAGKGLQGILDDMLKKFDDILLDLVFKQLQDVIGSAIGDMLSSMGVLPETLKSLGLMGEMGSPTNPMYVIVLSGVPGADDLKDAIDPAKALPGAVDPCSCISDLPGAVGDGVKKATDAADTASETAKAVTESVPEAIKKAAPEIVDPIAEVCEPLVEPIKELPQVPDMIEQSFEPVFENLSQFGEAAASILPTPDMTFTSGTGFDLVKPFVEDFPDMIDFKDAVDPLKDLIPGFEEYIQTIPDAWVEPAMPTIPPPLLPGQVPPKGYADFVPPMPPELSTLPSMPPGGGFAMGTPPTPDLVAGPAMLNVPSSMTPSFGSDVAQTALGVPSGAEDLVQLSKDSTDAITKWTDSINGSTTKVPLFDESLTRTGVSMDRLSDTSLPDVGASLDAFSTKGTEAATEGMITNSTSAITSAASLDVLSSSATTAAGSLAAAPASEGAGAGIFSIFGFASGGYLPPGDIGMVGEQGPELIYGGSTGATIAPMGTSTDSDHQVNLINNTSMQMTKTQKTTEDGRGRRRTDVLLEEVYSTSATGTQPRKTMNDFYGIRPRLIRA